MNINNSPNQKIIMLNDNLKRLYKQEIDLESNYKKELETENDPKQKEAGSSKKLNSIRKNLEAIPKKQENLISEMIKEEIERENLKNNQDDKKSFSRFIYPCVWAILGLIFFMLINDDILLYLEKIEPIERRISGKVAYTIVAITTVIAASLSSIGNKIFGKLLNSNKKAIPPKNLIVP